MSKILESGFESVCLTLRDTLLPKLLSGEVKAPAAEAPVAAAPART